MNPTPPADKKRTRISIGNAAFLLVVAGFAGQLLGFLRTKLVNANFPTTGPGSTDAYFAAFNIPDFFFFTLAAGALGVAFMPVVSDIYYKQSRRDVWKITAWLMNLMAIVMLIVGIIMIVFAEPLIQHIVAPGLPQDQLDTAATIMRFLALNPFLFTISGIFTSVQQTMGRFFFFAIAPLFYNLSIIASIYIFKDTMGLEGLGLGALIGAILQLLVVLLGLYKTGYRWYPQINFRSKEFITVLKNLPPRAIDQGMDQIGAIVETRIASGLAAGSITFYNNAYILSTAPILLIGTAISTAAFPRLNSQLSKGRPDLFRRDFLMVLRAMIWLAAPLVVVAFFSRGYLARLIFSNGNYQIATIFGFLCMAIFFRIMYAIISRWFYAQKDTRTPLFVSLFTIGLNIVLAINLAKPEAYGVAGLALAQSIVAAIEVAILSLVMVYRDHKLFDLNFLNGVFKIFAVTGFSVVASFIMISLYPLGLNDKGIFTLGSKLLLITAVTFSVHVLISGLFGLEETKPIFARIKKILYKPVDVSV